MSELGTQHLGKARPSPNPTLLWPGPFANGSFSHFTGIEVFGGLCGKIGVMGIIITTTMGVTGEVMVGETIVKLTTTMGLMAVGIMGMTIVIPTTSVG